MEDTMINYISADKLIAEIERRIQRCEDCEREGEPDTTSSEATLKSLRSFINSLQQEQPVQNGKFVFPKYLYARTKDNKTIDMSYAPQDMTAMEYIRNDLVEQEQLDGYNRAMIEVKEKVDELYNETSIGLNEYDSGLYNGVAETCMKLRGFIKARLDSDEQPEVELEKEIKAEWDVIDPDLLRFEEFKAVCYRFYELGLNARKEE